MIDHVNIQSQEPDLSGIFHWSGAQEMTKYDMGVAMARAFDRSSDHIQADNTVSSGATRPYNAKLDRSRLEGLGIVSDTPFEEGIRLSLKDYI